MAPPWAAAARLPHDLYGCLAPGLDLTWCHHPTSLPAERGKDRGCGAVATTPATAAESETGCEVAKKLVLGLRRGDPPAWASALPIALPPPPVELTQYMLALHRDGLESANALLFADECITPPAAAQPYISGDKSQAARLRSPAAAPDPSSGCRT